MHEAYERGYADFFKGNLTSSYRGILLKEWLRGFNTAYFENMKGKSCTKNSIQKRSKSMT
jgi:hypothetical protein